MHLREEALADYHVPVQSDVPAVQVHFIGRADPHISPIGARAEALRGEVSGARIAINPE